MHLDQNEHLGAESTLMNNLIKPWCVTLAGVVVPQKTGSRLPEQDGRDGEGGGQLSTRPEESAGRVHSDAGVCGGLQ